MNTNSIKSSLVSLLAKSDIDIPSSDTVITLENGKLDKLVSTIDPDINGVEGIEINKAGLYDRGKSYIVRIYNPGITYLTIKTPDGTAQSTLTVESICKQKILPVFFKNSSDVESIERSMTGEEVNIENFELPPDSADLYYFRNSTSENRIINDPIKVSEGSILEKKDTYYSFENYSKYSLIGTGFGTVSERNYYELYVNSFRLDHYFLKNGEKIYYSPLYNLLNAEKFILCGIVTKIII